MKKSILLLLIVPLLLHAQVNPKGYIYGVFAGYSTNYHVADFQKLPDCPSCSPGFREGIGGSASLGVSMEFPLEKKALFSATLLYQGLSGRLTRYEPTTLIVNGIAQSGEFEHSIETTLRTVGIESSVKYPILGKLSASLGFFAAWIYSATYSQAEKITKPTEFGTFLDSLGNDTQSRVRNTSAGALASVRSLFFAPSVGLTYKLSLVRNAEFYLEPGLSYRYALTNIVSEPTIDKWSVNSLTFGLSFKYTPKAKIEIRREYRRIENVDTLIVESENVKKRTIVQGKERIFSNVESAEDTVRTTDHISRTDTLFYPKLYRLNATLSLVGVDKDGKEVKNPTLNIKKDVYKRLDPILNYVFFEENSSEIPERYRLLGKKEAGKFEIDSLYQLPTLGIYYHSLNIIAKRLLKFPDATLTIVGCNANVGAEHENIALSEKRAEMVKNYFTQIWNISEERLAISAQNLPDKSSTPIHHPEKVEENRRVEIYSNDSRILEPLFIENVHRTANRSSIRFQTEVQSDAGIQEWEILAYQIHPKDHDAFRLSGNGEVPQTTDWKFEENQFTIPKLNQPLYYQLLLTDNKGQKFRTELQRVMVEIQKNDEYEIEKFSLILFDFDKSEIAGNNEKIMELIRRRITQHSTIEIKGYTDRTGDDNYNQRLSARRANSAKNFLGRSEAEAVGIGEQELLYDNDVPEGRFYCRTVEIILKTRIQE